MKSLKPSRKKLKKRPVNKISPVSTIVPKYKNTRTKLKYEIFFRKYLVHIRNFVLIFIAFVLIFLIYSELKDSRFLKINNVEISGTEEYVGVNDLKYMLENKLYEQNLFTLNTNELKLNILDNFLGAKNVEISKKFPNKIIVNVIERKPIALLDSSTDENMYLIDEDGYVLGQAGESLSGFTIINFEGDVRVGQFIDASIIPVSAEILKKSGEMEIKLTSMSFNSKYVKVYVANGAEVYLSTSKDIEKSLSAVAQIIKNIALEGKVLKKIDLRYDKVIVLYD